jgi:hypothetical protein
MLLRGARCLGCIYHAAAQCASGTAATALDAATAARTGTAHYASNSAGCACLSSRRSLPMTYSYDVLGDDPVDVTLVQEFRRRLAGPDLDRLQPA